MMDFTDVKIWESDEKGFFIWSATNGNKCYLHEYIEFLQKELEAARQIVNSERHELITKKHLWGLAENESKRLEYLQGKIEEWWPMVGENEKIKLKELLKGGK